MKTQNAFAGFKLPEAKKGIHSDLHLLVDEARRMFGEDAKKGKGSFGYYLGFFKRLGLVRVRQFLAEAKDAPNPKRAFWWRVGDDFKRRRDVDSGNPQSTH